MSARLVDGCARAVKVRAARVSAPRGVRRRELEAGGNDPAHVYLDMLSCAQQSELFTFIILDPIQRFRRKRIISVTLEIVFITHFAQTMLDRFGSKAASGSCWFGPYSFMHIMTDYIDLGVCCCIITYIYLRVYKIARKSICWPVPICLTIISVSNTQIRAGYRLKAARYLLSILWVSLMVKWGTEY